MTDSSPKTGVLTPAGVLRGIRGCYICERACMSAPRAAAAAVKASCGNSWQHVRGVDECGAIMHP